jgi:hypothetical protein
MNQTKTVNDGIWVVKENTALNSLTIAEGASVAAPEGKAVTMTVDGIGTPLKPGIYTGDVFLSVTEKYLAPRTGMQRGDQPEFRTAILIENGKYIAGKSVQAIVRGGKVTNKATTGVSISGTEESFNGIIIDGDTEYAIDGVKIDFEGNGANDFIAWGAGIAAIGNAHLTINNTEVKIKGVTRCAFHAGGNSVTTLNNCRLINESPVKEKFRPMWALGLSGTNRTTQLCDKATVYYNNCYVMSNGWGVLSIDGGVRVRMYLKDSTVELIGPRARGYGAFSIGDAFISYDHCTLNVQGYPLLMGGHGNSNGDITNCTVINSSLYGLMIFRDTDGHLKVDKGSTINSALSTFLVKGSSATINVDNAKLNPANGVILQLMDNDDPGMGPNRFIPPIGADKPIPGRDLTKADLKEDIFMTISNTEVSGDFYNSTTNLKANCIENIPMPYMAGMGDAPPMKIDNEAFQGVKNLDFKIVNAKVNSVISAATAAYREGVVIIEPSNCKELSAVKQTANEAVNNGVIVSIDKDSTWTVTGTSYLTKLTIVKGAVIKAPKGKKLNMMVDGVKTAIAPGTYTGKIVMTIA